MSNGSTSVHEGRTWVFAEPNINTDVLMPASTFGLPRAEQAAAVLGTMRPGWAQTVQPGDILVGGRNFGTGSARQVPLLLLDLGIRCVVADTIPDLFYRNSINLGLAALQCEGITNAVDEGQILKIDLGSGLVMNTSTGRQLRGHPTPSLLLEMLAAGGLEAQLKSKGHVK